MTFTQHSDGRFTLETTGPNGKETEEGSQEGNFGEVTQYRNGSQKMAGYSFANGTDTVIFETPSRHRESFQRVQKGEPSSVVRSQQSKTLPSTAPSSEQPGAYSFKSREPSSDAYVGEEQDQHSIPDDVTRSRASASQIGRGEKYGVGTQDVDAPSDGSVNIRDDNVEIQENGNNVELRNDGSTRIDSGNLDFDRGVEALLAGRNEESLSRLTNSLISDPTNPQAYLNRSEAHLSRKEYREASDDATKALQLSSEGWLYRSGHSSRGQQGDSLIRKDMGSAFLKRGLARQELNQKELAFEDFQQAMRSGVTDSFEAQLYSGQFEFNRGDNQKAAAYYAAAVNLRPNDGMARCLRGLVGLRTGDEAAANRDFAEAARLNPDFRAQCEGYAQSIRRARRN